MKNDLVPSSFNAQALSKKGSALTIGNFDGVHQGHQALLRQLIQKAQKDNLLSGVMTFIPHPREYFALRSKRPELIPTRISTLRDKVCFLQQLGIDFVVLKRFGQAMSQLSPEAFIEDILVKQLNTRYLIVGEDFHFGHQRRGDFTLLKEAGQEFGFKVSSIKDVKDHKQIRYSSTELRFALAVGDLKKAEQFLGRPYCISGRVIHGKKLGRTLGFPTLNIKVATPCAPRSGVYVVKVKGINEQPLAGIASLGVRPTTDNDGRVLLEVHILDANLNLYGKLLSVELLQFVRDEEKFPNLETMINAIENDVSVARNYFNVNGL